LRIDRIVMTPPLSDRSLECRESKPSSFHDDVFGPIAVLDEIGAEPTVFRFANMQILLNTLLRKNKRGVFLEFGGLFLVWYVCTSPHSLGHACEPQYFETIIRLLAVEFASLTRAMRAFPFKRKREGKEVVNIP
jgi:hypothetical protein